MDLGFPNPVAGDHAMTINRASAQEIAMQMEDLEYRIKLIEKTIAFLNL